MKTERVETGKAPHIDIDMCRSDLVIRGWDELSVLIKGDDYQVVESEAGLSFSSDSGLRLMVPASSQVHVKQAAGDLVIKNVDGDVTLDEASGDTVLVGLGSVKIGNVLGDLSMKRTSGPVEAASVHGDVAVREVAGLAVGEAYGDFSARVVTGDAQLGEVMGDVSLRGVTGDVIFKQVLGSVDLRDLGGLVKVSDVRGDISIRGSFGDGEHNFKADGDIVLHWPADAPIELTVVAGSISNRIDFHELSESDTELSGKIEGGDTLVTLTAKGQVVIKDLHGGEEKWEWDQSESRDFGMGFDFSGLGERISRQVNQQIAGITRDFERKFGPEYSQKIAEKISQKAEQAAAKAERAAERAMRRAERSSRRAAASSAPRRRPPTPPPAKKVSTEEQLKILKMVEQGTITTDEASVLLEALGS